MKTPVFKIYPARAGLIVRDPRTLKPLSPNGETKPKNGYWLRRLREGSVTKTAPAAADKQAGTTAEKPAAKQAKTAKSAVTTAGTDGADNG